MIDFAAAVKNARLQPIVDALDADVAAAKILLYDGTKPTPGGAITTQTLLATLTLAQPAGSITTATLTLAPAAATYMVAGDGLATWGRAEDGAGLWVFDGDAGLAGSGALYILDDALLFAGGLVSLLSATISEP